jgi:hypothetical protein
MSTLKTIPQYRLTKHKSAVNKNLLQIHKKSVKLNVVFFQLMQFAYGVATSTEVAYFTYIYAKVNYSTERRRLREGNAKCRHLKKLTFKRTLWQVFIFLRPRIPHSHTLTHCILVRILYTVQVYTVYLFTQ